MNAPRELATEAGKQVGCRHFAARRYLAIPQFMVCRYCASCSSMADPGFRACNRVAIARLATLPSQACCPNAEARVGLVDGLDLALKLCDDPCPDLRNDWAERSAR
jgi:hypothetical protein